LPSLNPSLLKAGGDKFTIAADAACVCFPIRITHIRSVNEPQCNIFLAAQMFAQVLKKKNPLESLQAGFMSPSSSLGIDFLAAAGFCLKHLNSSLRSAA
jgi:hypothetical protein